MPRRHGSGLVLLGLVLAGVSGFGLLVSVARAGDEPNGSWPSKIGTRWESVEDVPVKNISGVKAMKLKLDLRAWDIDKSTGKVKSITGGLTHIQIHDDSSVGWFLWAFDDAKMRFPLPELVVDGMEATAVETFTLFRKNTSTTTLRANKAIPDELELTISHTNYDDSSIPIKKVKFRQARR